MTRPECMKMLRALPVVSSHCHHARAEVQAGLSLSGMLNTSYAGWCGVPVGETPEEHAAYVDHLGANTYFVWLSKAVAELYQCGEITAEHWEGISEAMQAAHADPEHHFRLLTERCRYRFVVQDSFWEPGADLGRPGFFRPAYRINAWAMSPRPGAVDHNDNSPWTDPNFTPTSVEEYLDRLELTIEAAVNRGAVAVKSALAYDRTVAFDRPDMAAARRAFSPNANASELAHEDLIAFGDVVFHRACEVAARLQVPFQVHLGLGRIATSNPMLFEPTIAAHPDTTFDLFHSGYPWCGEVAGLLHNYGNVVADLCWVPLISTTAAVRALHEYLDVARSSDRIIWGDDTQSSEEAYGALLAWEYVVARVLSERVQDGLCTRAQATVLAEKLMFRNGEKLFGEG